jgi:hypothetical protein
MILKQPAGQNVSVLLMLGEYKVLAIPSFLHQRNHYLYQKQHYAIFKDTDEQGSGRQRIIDERNDGTPGGSAIQA